jgi:hypothetical protein
MQVKSYLLKATTGLQSDPSGARPEPLSSLVHQDPLWMEVGRTCVVSIIIWLTPSRLSRCFELPLAPREGAGGNGRHGYGVSDQALLSVRNHGLSRV